VQSLDSEKDIELLKEYFPGIFTDDNFRILQITTMFLKKTVAAGYCLYEIGNWVTKPMSACGNPTSYQSSLDPKSELEILCEKARQKPCKKCSDKGTDEISSTYSLDRKNCSCFLRNLSDLIDDFVEERKPLSAVCLVI
jgi:hypothetical protein